MKAVVKYAEGEGNIELRDVPEPKPDLNEVRIKVEAVGICGSDLYIFKGDKGSTYILRYSYKDRGRVGFVHQDIVTCFVQFCCVSVSPIC
mgnify:CR=1 FL=1